MMINLKIFVGILTGILVIGGAVVTFFQMQTRQNMKIEALEKEVTEIRGKEIPELKRKLSEQSHYQIETEKAIIEINGKLDHISEAIEELKKGGNS
ncbi:MAG: hypothetical protein PQJ46_09380 [Spirochaetales bacterium]|nr:hypothetical protein [Spirochaetales bacterium]